MKNLKQKTKNYELEINDFIPIYGIFNHAKRNANEKYKDAFPRSLVLITYNAALQFGSSALLADLLRR